MIYFALFALLIVMPSQARGQQFPQPHPDDYAYDRIVRVRGTVVVLNHPTLGKTPGTGTYLVFQRQGCRDCVIATRTDSEGNYELFLGRGKYKLIVRDARGGLTPSKEMLAADQKRYLEMGPRDRDVTFDIRLSLPVDR